MNKKLIYWGIPISVVLFVVFLFLVSINSFLSNSVLGLTSYETHVKVGSYVGFNLEADKIYFGTVNPGGLGKRELTLNSSVSGYVVVRVDGEMKDMLLMMDKYEKVNAGENLHYTLYANPSKSQEFGEYESKIYFYILKSRNKLAESFLPGSEIKYLSNADVLNKPAYVRLKIAGNNNTNESSS